jgi:hypothetical protein
LQYRRRGAPAIIEWSPHLAYAVGLIATDGCLSGDGRHITFVSKDEDQMRTLLSLVDRAHIRYRRVETEFGGWAFRGEFSYAALYRWLLTVGLMPAKSLVLGGIDVADEHLMPVVRGLLDGDGTIYTLVHHPTRRTRPQYRYERLWTYFNSGSRKHVEWIQERLARAFEVSGYIETVKQKRYRNPIYRLKYGNRASHVLLPAIYADQSVPRLNRKWLKWSDYMMRHPLCGRRDLNPHDLTATRP